MTPYLPNGEPNPEYWEWARVYAEAANPEHRQMFEKEPMNDRTTRNNVYDIITTSAYVFGICILVVMAFAIGKGIYLIIKY